MRTASALIDDALRNDTPETVVCLMPRRLGHLRPRWLEASNYALGKFRSLKELADSAESSTHPAFEATFRNLYMNRRVSLLQLPGGADSLEACASEVDDALFRVACRCTSALTCRNLAT